MSCPTSSWKAEAWVTGCTRVPQRVCVDGPWGPWPLRVIRAQHTASSLHPARCSARACWPRVCPVLAPRPCPFSPFSTLQPLVHPSNPKVHPPGSIRSSPLRVTPTWGLTGTWGLPSEVTTPQGQPLFSLWGTGHVHSSCLLSPPLSRTTWSQPRVLRASVSPSAAPGVWCILSAHQRQEAFPCPRTPTLAPPWGGCVCGAWVGGCCSAPGAPA